VEAEVASSGETRYGMLETLRAYARERLASRGETEPVQRRHAAYYLALAEAAAPRLRGVTQRAWLDRLEQAHDNLRAAVDWLTTRGPVQDGLRLGSALASFWMLRGSPREGTERLTRLLDVPGSTGSGARAAALMAAGYLALSRGDHALLHRLAKAELPAFREVGDEWGCAWALNQLGIVANAGGAYETARDHFEASLAIRRRLGDRQGIVASLSGLGGAARLQGDWATAHAVLDDGLAEARTIGHRGWTAAILRQMGWLALDQQRWGLARARFEEGLAIHDQLGSQLQAAMAATELGHAVLAAGDVATARALYRESLPRHRAAENWLGMALAFEGCAGLVAHAAPAQALRLAGAATALRTAMRRPLPAVERPLVERWLAPARRAVGADVAAAAWVAGETLGPEQAVDEALEAIAEPAPVASGDFEAAGLSAEEAAPLTPREREVAALVAAGLTNRELAAALVVTERTAGAHVEHILAKLGLRNRAQITAWVVERGLRRSTPELERPGAPWDSGRHGQEGAAAPGADRTPTAPPSASPRRRPDRG
jgi:non-specific serine/threonine protein kinase